MTKTEKVKILSAAAMIERDLHEHITIKKMAASLFMNQTKLKKGFRQVLGKGPYRYLMEKRLEKAKLMILEERSIREIASAVGFNGQQAETNFIKFFKKQMKQTPMEWKRAQAKEEL